MSKKDHAAVTEKAAEKAEPLGTPGNPCPDPSGGETAPAAQAAGVLDHLPLVLPFLFDPTKIAEFADGVKMMLVTEPTITGKWAGFKKAGDVAIPLIQKFQDRARISAAVADSLDEEAKAEYMAAANIAPITTFEAADAYFQAAKLGDGQLLKKLRDAFTGLSGSPMGRMLIELLLKQATGGLLGG